MNSQAPNDLTARAQHWLDNDPDPDTVTALKAALADPKQLAELFAGPLEFGTAGLRGLIGPGESRMNLSVVATTTDALLTVLEKHVDNAHERGLVIGFDGRTKSREFADGAAIIAAKRGFKVWLFAEVAPTPLVAFALQYAHAAAGIVVTASHNPPAYNGYKVYWENGAQIIPPVDEWIRDASSVSAKRGAKAIIADAAGAEPLAAPRAWRDAYRDGVLALRVHPEIDLSGVSVAYTPMHGVGADTLLEIFGRAKIQTHIVQAQARPDAAFPTVKFPNPEEPGAMDLVLALARENQCALAIANDPDADRLCVAVREGEDYRVLSGNEVGTLLGAYFLSERKSKQPVVAASLVSSTQLSKLAAAHDAKYLETLTGFKWIANAAMKTPGDFLFGYEEALGYTVGTLVRDKDGISAALLFCELQAWLAKSGRSIADFQKEIAKKIGVFASQQKSLAMTPAAMKVMMAALRQALPRALADQAVQSVRDYATGGDLPPTDMLAFSLRDARVLVRPSGTEPKLKIYVETSEADVAGAADKAKARCAALAQATEKILLAHAK